MANRFYYQLRIPLKDAAILSNSPEREVRRDWIKRIVDHDGAAGAEGGIERWLALTGEAVGLPRAECASLARVLLGAGFAYRCAYVHFARTAPWQEAVAASLTELFAADIHRQRLESLAEELSPGSAPTASPISGSASTRRRATCTTACV